MIEETIYGRSLLMYTLDHQDATFTALLAKRTREPSLAHTAILTSLRGKEGAVDAVKGSDWMRVWSLDPVA